MSEQPSTEGKAHELLRRVRNTAAYDCGCPMRLGKHSPGCVVDEIDAFLAQPPDPHHIADAGKMVGAEPGNAFVAEFKREPTSPSDCAWMNGYAAALRRSPEPAAELIEIGEMVELNDGLGTTMIDWTAARHDVPAGAKIYARLSTTKEAKHC